MTSTILPRSRTAGGTAYHDVGNGEPLVLIHGVGLRAEAWRPQVDALAAARRVVAVDMPGHGGSVPLRPGARLPDFVAWFGRFLDELGLETTALAGHSMGALIAGGAAATFGPRIERVALLNGVHRRSPEARAAVEARSRAIDSGEVDVVAPLRRWFAGDEVDGEPYRLTLGWLQAVDPAGYGTAYAAFAAGDEVYADAWPSVAGPALFLTGDGDANSTPTMARAMAAAAPRGEAVVVPGHRHLVNLTAPAPVNDALRAWLAR